MKEIINVCVFDDNEKVRNALDFVFTSMSEGINITGSYADVSNLKDKISKSNPDVILMDIEMPGVNGIEAVKEIKKMRTEALILMFTVFENEDLIFESICAGASGYLLKNSQPQKISDSIKEVMNGGSPMTPTIARKVLERFKGGNSNKDYHLSSREKEVLQHLTAGKSHKMIAEACNISYDTVRAHIKKIYSKLHVASMTEAVAKAIQERIV